MCYGASQVYTWGRTKVALRGVWTIMEMVMLEHQDVEGDGRSRVLGLAV